MRDFFKKLPIQLKPFLFLVVLSALIITLVSTNSYVHNKVTTIKSQLDGLKQLEGQLSDATFSKNWQEVKENLNLFQAQLATVSKEAWFLRDIQDLADTTDQLLEETQKLLPILERLPEVPQEIISGTSESDLSEQIEITLISSQKILELSLDLSKQLEDSLSLKLAGSQAETIIDLKDRISFLTPYLQLAQTHLPALQELLGVKSPQKIMVLLQNSAELRPGGGFIGSFLIIDTNDGVITNITPFDSYQIDGQLADEIPVPAELGPVTNRLTIHDANTSPSFPVTAELVTKLYESAGGPTVDTVIAVNLDLLEDFLLIAGPISTTKGTLSAANFQQLLNYQIEDIKDDTNNPKQVFFDLIPKVLDKFAATAKSNPLKIIDLTQKALNKKSVQIFSSNPQIQKTISFLSLENSYLPLPTTTDELLVTHTSVGGNKSDRYLKTRYTHQTELAHRERIVNHLTLKLHHSFNDEAEQILRAELGKSGIWYPRTEFIELLGKGINKTRYKIYVPEDAKLLTVNGLDISEVTDKPAHDLEGRQLFSFLAELAPGETKEVTLVYELDTKFKASPVGEYSLKVHKAPGVNQTTFEKRYHLMDQLYVRDSSPRIPVLYERQEYKYEEPLLKDLNYSVSLSH